MVRPDSQIKASKGPAVSMLCCWMIRAFHRLGKTLCRTWQAGLFPVWYAEQTLSMNWAQPPGMAREATNSTCISKYWATLNSSSLNKLPFREGLCQGQCKICAKALPLLGAGGSWWQGVGGTYSKKTVKFLYLMNPWLGA